MPNFNHFNNNHIITVLPTIYYISINSFNENL